MLQGGGFDQINRNEIIGTSAVPDYVGNRMVAAVPHNSTGAALPIQWSSVVSAAARDVQANPFIV